MVRKRKRKRATVWYSFKGKWRRGARHIDRNTANGAFFDLLVLLCADTRQCVPASSHWSGQGFACNSTFTGGHTAHAYLLPSFRLIHVTDHVCFMRQVCADPRLLLRLADCVQDRIQGASKRAHQSEFRQAHRFRNARLLLHGVLRMELLQIHKISICSCQRPPALRVPTCLSGSPHQLQKIQLFFFLKPSIT
jgi:hypothetical protein